MTNPSEQRKAWLRACAATAPASKPVSDARRAWLRARAADNRTASRPAAAAMPSAARPAALILSIAAVVGAVGMLVGF